MAQVALLMPLFLAYTLPLTACSVAALREVRYPPLPAQIAAAAIELFVSPSGSDTADGRTPATALQHLQAARDRLRQLRASASRGCAGAAAACNADAFAVAARVWLLPGTYTPAQTLNLTALDSNVAWAGLLPPPPPPSAADGRSTPLLPIDELPVISGGGAQLQWAPTRVPGASRRCRLLTARSCNGPVGAGVVGMVYPQLYVNGERAPVARAPAGALANPRAYYEWAALPGNASTTAFLYNRSDVNPSAWAPANDSDALGDVTALVFDSPWGANPRRIALINASTDTIHLNAPLVAPLTHSLFLGVKRWVAFNVQAGTLAPNTYRYRSDTATFTYNYCGTGEMPHFSVAPTRLATVVRLSDGAANITFTGIRFSHTAVSSDPPTFS